MEWRMEDPSLCARVRFAAVLLLWLLRPDRADTTPPEKTNDPTPRSMRDVPQFSTLANRRGKTRKSTARMAMQVMIIMAPR